MDDWLGGWTNGMDTCIGRWLGGWVGECRNNDALVRNKMGFHGIIILPVCTPTFTYIHMYMQSQLYLPN